jgi:hypothetical protein
VTWTWRRGAWAAFLGIFAGFILAAGVVNLTRGYIPEGLTDLGVVALAVIIEVLTWLNWRILKLNGDLMDENRRLRGG